jgi:flagellar M-ring protein FliF
MDTALAPATAGSPVPTVPLGANGQPLYAGAAPQQRPGVLARWSALPGKTQFMALAGAAALVAVIALLVLSSKSSDYRVLFPNLSEKDGGQVIERLAQMNVPYKIADGSGSVMVPSARVHELRMKLAAAGLPANGGGFGPTTGPGFELLDKQTFGQTQGQERIAVQRALQGELTRTIQQISAVSSARVHLALPNQNGFFREQQKPSASVVLTLHPGHTLDRAQLAGIVHLVASSVPEMNRKAVSVIDSSGALLSGDGESIEGLDSAQLQYRRELEQGHVKRVLALLEPVVGRDNVRASVTAEVDFSQVMSTAETHAPNQGAQAQVAVREQNTQESSEPGPSVPAGVPGATSNQPAPATAPIQGAAAPLQGAGGGGGGNSTRREQATRFEVDKTVTVTKNAVGNVKRLSAAVVLNHKVSTDAKGKTTSTAYSEKEIEQMTALVQQALGFDAERGDQVKLINAPFRTEQQPTPESVPLWQQPWAVDLAKTAAAPLALALVGLMAVFALLRPATKALFAPPPPPPAPEKGSQLSTVVDDDNALPGGDDAQLGGPGALKALPAPAHAAKLEAARALAKENPAAVANIVRGWVNGETA